jgi:hypothetical protein
LELYIVYIVRERKEIFKMDSILEHWGIVLN